MKRHGVSIVGVFLVFVGMLAASEGNKFQPVDVPQADLDKITSAMPEKPSAKPMKKRKVLVFWRCEGFPHKSISWGNKCFEIMGNKTGAFDVELSDEMSVFNAEKLKEFDAVLFNNTTGLKFEDENSRKALMDFIKGGKGIIGIHAATDNFPTWPEGQEMMGGKFAGHPWGGGGTWAMSLEDAAHPLNKGFDGKGFKVKDEIYQIMGPYDREKQRILIKLDLEDQKTAEAAQKAKREDKDFAVAWIKRCGEGRVFYCSLGHNNEIFWTTSILQHYLDGIQYAMGDYKVDDSPSKGK